MLDTNANDVFKILLESLKIQAEKYKSLVDQDLTHEQRKDFDTEIKQMFELLTTMTNSSIVYTLSEIQALKIQYEAKIKELTTTLDNIDVTTVKGDNGKSAYEIAVQNGYEGSALEWLKSLIGEDGKSFTFDMFTPEQLASFKGLDGKSAYEIAVQNGYEGSALEWLKSLIGQDGKSFTFDMFTPEQLSSFKGLDGKSAYEVAVQNGYEGSALEWLKSLIGQDGKSFTFDMFTPEQLESLKGKDGLPLTYDSLTLAQKEELASHVTVSGSGSSTIEDIEGLPDVIGDLYTKHGEQEQKFGGINLSQFYQQTQGHLGELDGKVVPLFNALFGVYEEDEATGQQILVQEGLIDRFNALNTQINPN